MSSAILHAFWEIAAWGVPPRLESAERRAEARFVSVACVVITIAGLFTAVLDAWTPGAEPAVSLVAAATGLAALGALRLSRTSRPVATVLVLLMGALGPGVHALHPEAGSPNLTWVLMAGFAPLLHPSTALTLGTLALSLVAAALTVLPPPTEPTLASLPDVLPIVVGAYVVMTVGLYLHHGELRELNARLAHERDVEALTLAATASVTARAATTASFLTTMSHELRTPLNGVLGLSDLLAHEDIPPSAAARLARIHGTGRSLLRAFDTLLCLTRLTAAGTSPREPLDLHGLVDATRTRAISSAGPLPVSLDVVVAQGTPRIVAADLVVLRTVLDQLLGSAFDAGVQHAVLDVSVRAEAITLRLVGEHAGIVPETASERSPLSLGMPLVAELARAAGGSASPVTGSARSLSVAITLPCSPAASPLGDPTRETV